jgi:hypothetical protein
MKRLTNRWCFSERIARGIYPTDPMIDARDAAYPVSFGRR